jgi:hypothetical protein
VIQQSRFTTGERRVGKQTKKHIIVFFVLIICLCTLASTVAAADEVTLSIKMLQGEQQTRFNKPVFVAGVWQYVNITMNQIIDELSLRFYKGITLTTGNKNETNYYEWKYDKNNMTVWNDVSGYGIRYIKQDSCFKNNTLFSFCIGIDDAMPNVVDYFENWTVEVSKDGTTIHSEGIVVEKPKTGISLSKPSSIIFYIDPFTVMDAQGDNFFKIGNIGNVPLYVNIDYEKYNDIEITDLNKKFLPDDIVTHYVIVHSRSWPPGIKKMDIQVNGSYPRLYFVDTNATVTLYTSFIIDVPQLVIYVGHSNYKIDEIQGTGITFQYLERLNMYEGEVKDISAYVSGNGAVTVEVSADEKNISALKLYDGDTETYSPISFTSTNTSERTIVVTVEALGEGKTGILTYKVSSDGVMRTYTTQITIGPPASPDKGISTNPGSIMQIIVIIVVLLVVIYMVLSYVKNRMR